MISLLYAFSSLYFFYNTTNITLLLPFLTLFLIIYNTFLYTSSSFHYFLLYHSLTQFLTPVLFPPFIYIYSHFHHSRCFYFLLFLTLLYLPPATYLLPLYPQPFSTSLLSLTRFFSPTLLTASTPLPSISVTLAQYFHFLLHFLPRHEELNITSTPSHTHTFSSSYFNDDTQLFRERISYH